MIEFKEHVVKLQQKQRIEFITLGIKAYFVKKSIRRLYQAWILEALLYLIYIALWSLDKMISYLNSFA